MQAGRLDIDGLRTETRVDARNTKIRIAVARAVPITVYNTADDITIVPAPGGYTLDAITSDGELSLDDAHDGGLAVAKAAGEREQRASGPVHGGGPAITLRNRGGDISIRTREEKDK